MDYRRSGLLICFAVIQVPALQLLSNYREAEALHI